MPGLKLNHVSKRGYKPLPQTILIQIHNVHYPQWDKLSVPLLWCYMHHDIWNHGQFECLFNSLFLSTTKALSRLWITSPLWLQRASNAENVSMWWRHHGATDRYCHCKMHIVRAPEELIVCDTLGSFEKPGVRKKHEPCVIKKLLWTEPTLSRGRKAWLAYV